MSMRGSRERPMPVYLTAVREVDWMDLIHNGHRAPAMRKAAAVFLKAEQEDRDGGRAVAAGIEE